MGTLPVNGYTELDCKQHQIRLLTLQAGLSNAPLRGDLETVSLGTESECRPRYQALSYVWGDGELVAHITINGRSMRITQNLEEALRALRDASCPITLWADQLCVNQDNYGERTHQVKLMKDIYKSAIEVLIWLGNSDNESRIAFKFISEHVKIWWWGNQLYMEERRKEYADGFHALCQLLKRPWFKRVWTLQEFALCSTLDGPLMICGEDRLGWGSFYSLGHLDSDFRKCYLKETHSSPLSKYFQNSQYYWSIISTMQSIRVNRTFGYHLYYLLRATAHHEASDPRDRIYALLACANKEYQQRITPDYSNTYIEVYIEATKCIIEIDKSLNILGFPAPEEKSKNLPSWVPDFSASLSRDSIPLLPQDLVMPQSKEIMPPNIWMQYWASRRQSPVFSFSEDRKCLSVKGMRFDIVGEVVGPFSTPESYLQRARKCTKRAMRKRLPRGHLHKALRRRSSLWRAFIADKDENGQVPAPLAYEGMIKTMLRKSRLSTSSRAIDASSESDYLIPTQRSLNAAIKDRRFFTTKKGFVGIGPDKIQKGDLVAVLFGADTPLILRPDGISFKLVGAAYVHGIMRGEMILLRRFGFSSRIFQLH